MKHAACTRWTKLWTIRKHTAGVGDSGELVQYTLTNRTRFRFRSTVQECFVTQTTGLGLLIIITIMSRLQVLLLLQKKRLSGHMSKMSGSPNFRQQISPVVVVDLHA
jgi:hypothetical protein